MLKGPDGKLRNCYPVLFSTAIDYPESCLFALVRSGTACPVCIIPQENFDDLSASFEFWDPISMSKAIRNAQKTKSLKGNKMAEAELQKIGLVDMNVSKKIYIYYIVYITF